MHSLRDCSRQAAVSGLALALTAALACIPTARAGTTPTARGSAAQQASHLALAANGAAQAMTAFRDGSHGIWNGRRNVPLRWYDERLGVHTGYPLATIWGAVPLFEALAAIAAADPTAATRGALKTFAEGAHPPAAPPSAHAASSTHRRTSAIAVYGGAESYWDAAVRGFAPYPGDRGRANTWFDDNSWWGIAFVDAYRVLKDARLLADAQAAFSFIAHRGWDAAGGGVWWNTAHTPNGQKSGEALAAGSLLGALLATALQEAAQSASGPTAKAERASAAFDLRTVEKFLSWGDEHFATRGDLYSRTQEDSTPMPYVAGPEIEAKELLCMLPASEGAFCAQAPRLADAAFARFAYRLNMGPQFDVIYLHWMLVYAQQTGDSRWLPMALTFAGDARSNARDPASGLYLKAWDGSDMSLHQAEPNMLRTDAASVELFGWLAADGA
jgi:Glycosyl hydrolase family 76